MDGYQENGKQKVVSFYGKTKEEVREKKRAYDTACTVKTETGIDIQGKYTFAEFADMWFERHQEELEDATIEHYTYILLDFSSVFLLKSFYFSLFLRNFWIYYCILF